MGKSEWHEGTSRLLFTPVELLEKLAALTPRPRINLVLYHGILAPRARTRAHAVAHSGAAPSPGEGTPTAAQSPGAEPSRPAVDVSATAPPKQPGERWEVTLSHEALELIGDPEVNLLVQGPHPTTKGKIVYHWYEMCDAVQAESYSIDGIPVSNFILPLYFTAPEERGGRADFLGTVHKGATLRSFGINPGGYIGFFDPETESHETVSIAGDEKAAKRLELKARYGAARRSVRYKKPQEAVAGRPGKDRPAPVAAEGVAVLAKTPLSES